jgi:hypothetical protein
VYIVFELDQLIRKLGFAADPAIRDLLFPAGFTFNDCMKREIPYCLQIMIMNDVPMRVAAAANKQRSKRFQSMVRPPPYYFLILCY